MKRVIVYMMLLVSIGAGLKAQTIVKKDSLYHSALPHDKFSYKALIIPAVLIGYGVIGIESDFVKSFNTEIQEEVTENIDQRITADDFAQYAPAAAVYTLNFVGVAGKHNLRDRSVILATSFVLMSATVFALKSTTMVTRPDGTSKNSFPSGHTATAFAGAEFLRKEYAEQSVWYGVAGYAIATGTGLFRIYNNRHWLTDVAAGAGIGILSTKVAYWMNPYLTKKLFGGKEGHSTTFVSPLYDGTNLGLIFVRTF